ncbi:MAG: PHP domain-containing protein [Methanomicrobiales archaeon]|nr:PHP domain-containing protein [Methanomicrobiales archaeon]
MSIQMKLAGEGEDAQASSLRLDMHVHSAFSRDSVVPVRSIVRTWRRAGVLSLVCDHNTIKGSRRIMDAIRTLNPEVPELLAEEITTTSGEIVGLFLNEEIPPGLSADETLDLIQNQGGLSLVPHPFCRYRSQALHHHALESLIEKIDIIEGFNARNVVDADNERASVFARERNKPISVGSDAHTPLELSRVWLEVPVFETPKELLRGLYGAPLSFRRSNSAVHVITKMVKMARRRDVFR